MTASALAACAAKLVIVSRKNPQSIFDVVVNSFFQLMQFWKRYILRQRCGLTIAHSNSISVNQ